jgi:hypothetical protein
VDTAAGKGRLHEFSIATGKMERIEEIQDGIRFHPGGIASDEQSVGYRSPNIAARAPA